MSDEVVRDSPLLDILEMPVPRETLSRGVIRFKNESREATTVSGEFETKKVSEDNESMESSGLRSTTEEAVRPGEADAEDPER